MGLAWTRKGLLWARFLRGEEAPKWPPWAAHWPERPIPRRYRRVLEGYLGGEPLEPAELPVVLHGSPFQRRVWSLLRRVPRGHLVTYGSLAARLGEPGAARAVGQAARANPIVLAVPCHRLVGAAGSLGGFSSGADLKARLLRLEGVAIEGDRALPGQLSLGDWLP